MKYTLLILLGILALYSCKKSNSDNVQRSVSLKTIVVYNPTAATYRTLNIQTFDYGSDGRLLSYTDKAIDSIVSGGCILSGGTVRNSILGRGVRIHSGAVVEDCVILDNCDIGRRSKIRRAVLDKNVRVPDDAMIGYDLERDRVHHHVTESGIVVIAGNRTPVDVTSLVV